jgi:hypothetical protein
MSESSLDLQIEQWEGLVPQWEAVTQWAQEQISACTVRLVNRDTTQSLEEVRDLQERIRTLKAFANLPRARLADITKKRR